MKHLSIVPEPLRAAYDLFGFSPGVKAGDELVISGQIGVNPDMTVPTDLADEFRNAFTYIGLILAEAGMGFDDIFELTSFHVSEGLMADAQTFNQVRAEFMSAPHPAWTMVGVSGLLIPGARVEICARAKA